MTPTEGQTTAADGTVAAGKFCVVHALSVLKEAQAYVSSNQSSPSLAREFDQVYDAVAALIARNAELEAVKDRLIVDIRKRDTAIHAWADQARNAEDGRDAIAAENNKMREDVERWREVESRYNGSKTQDAVAISAAKSGRSTNTGCACRTTTAILVSRPDY